MITASQIREQLIEKATDNEEFRTRLLDDPQATVEDEFGITFPEGFSVEVHEESATEAHLVLPPVAKLTEADLQGVAGGGAGCVGTSCAWV